MSSFYKQNKKIPGYIEKIPIKDLCYVGELFLRVIFSRNIIEKYLYKLSSYTV